MDRKVAGRPARRVGGARDARPRLVAESLEGRTLLAGSVPMPQALAHTAGGAAYLIQVSGPGRVQVAPAGHGQVAINLLGTTAESQVTVTPRLIRARYAGTALQIGKIAVRSGQLGGFNAATTADLDGPMSPLRGPVQSLQFAALAGPARIQVKGTLGQLAVGGDATLAAGGGIQVGGPLTVGGNLTANGGALAATSIAVAGALTIGGSGLELGGAGALRVGGDLDINAGGLVHVAQDRTAPISIGGSLNIAGGRLAVDRDLTTGLAIGGDLAVTARGSLAVGRDLADGLAVGGNLTAASGGMVTVGRNVAAIRVTGNVDTGGGGQILVGGDVDAFLVSGTVTGRGVGSGDITVGLDLDNFQVLGGAANAGGIKGLDLAVGKNINGLRVVHGIFASELTAGVQIDGAAGLPAAGLDAANFGPDGVVAVFDTTILAGAAIRNLTIGGDVVSDRPTNPAGLPTRIVAGLNRQGVPAPNGLIDNVRIEGRLVDAVLAASVAPAAPGGIYDRPAGTIEVGYVAGPKSVEANFTAPPFAAAKPTDIVLPGGAINPSFAPPALPPVGASTVSSTTGPAGTVVTTTVFNGNGTETITTTGPTGTSSSTVPAPNMPIPLPSRPTVAGGVVSTAHDPDADYAGLFAANTAGVIVGGPPGNPNPTAGSGP